MEWMLYALAAILKEYEAEFKGCDCCDGLFDYEFTDMWIGEEITLCPACQLENEETWAKVMAESAAEEGDGW